MSGTPENEDTAPRQGYIPKPPSKADLDEVSRDQGLITDDWTGPAPGEPGTERGNEPGTKDGGAKPG